jgi:hypothetical protein
MVVTMERHLQVTLQLQSMDSIPSRVLLMMLSLYTSAVVMDQPNQAPLL